MKNSILAFVVLCMALSCHAQQIIHVPDDYNFIQDAIAAASYGDTILVAPGTYMENITIQGTDKIITLASNFLVSGDTNDINNTIIDAGSPENENYGMGILIKNQISLDRSQLDQTSVIGFTIMNGTGYYKTYGGGVYVTQAAPVIRNNHIRDCYITGVQPTGGGIYVGICPDSTLSCRIQGNRITGCVIQITESTGLVGRGAGIGLTNVNAIVEGNDISSNYILGDLGQYGYGAGIYYNFAVAIQYHPLISILDNVINNNHIASSIAQGGGIYLFFDASNTVGTTSYMIQRNTINNNELDGMDFAGTILGGGIYMSSPGEGSFISGNTISGNLCHNNLVSCYGGGIYIRRDINLPTDEILLVEKNRIYDNEANEGGGIFNQRNGTDLVNNIIMNNFAHMQAPAIYYQGPNDDQLTVKMTNNSIVSNSVDVLNASGSYILGNFNALLMNTIFWGNATEMTNELFIDPNVNSVYINNCDIDPEQIVGAYTLKDNIKMDPDFIDDSCHIDENSPCEDAGTASVFIDDTWYYAPLEDINGSIRPWHEAFDIGAYECDIISSVPEPNPIELTGIIVRVSPNPVVNNLTIEVELKANETVYISACDVTGRMVMKMLNSELSKGEHSFVRSMDYLKTGVYFIKVRTGHENQTVKIVKLD